MGLCTIFILSGNRIMVDVAVMGAGVAGLTCACELVNRGISVTVYERSAGIGEAACSWYAGGMLAPYCEAESAEQAVVELGLWAKGWWKKYIPDVSENGSLVISLERDQSELRRFAKLTEQHVWLDHDRIGELEPDLAGRFEKGLFFAEEAHINPRQALQALADYLIGKGVIIEFGQEVLASDLGAEYIIDCRGFAASQELTELRGVKGEMLILRSQDIHLSRPIRLLHPRYPIYIVPRGQGEFMVGATMIENHERSRISALSMLELLSAAYALHSGFGEAEVVEIGVDVRPAFADNLPKLCRHDNVIYLNGLFRHGFLLSPAMAMQVADAVTCEKKYRALPIFREAA